MIYFFIENNNQLKIFLSWETNKYFWNWNDWLSQYLLRHFIYLGTLLQYCLLDIALTKIYEGMHYGNVEKRYG